MKKEYKIFFARLGLIFMFFLGILLLARQAHADTTYTSTGDNNEQYYVGRVNQRKVAQKVVITTSGTISALTCAMNDYSAPADLTCDIQTDNGGNPSHYSIATTTVTAAESSTSCTDFTDTFTPVNITAGTYWIVWETTGSNNTNFWDACGNTTSPAAPNDNRDMDNTLVWENILTGISRYSFTVVETTPSATTATTTDTYSQSQENLYHAFILFLIGFFGMIYLIRRK